MRHPLKDGLDTGISLPIQLIPKAEKRSHALGSWWPNIVCILCLKIGLTFILVFGTQIVETILFDLDVEKLNISSVLCVKSEVYIFKNIRKAVI